MPMQMTDGAAVMWKRPVQVTGGVSSISFRCATLVLASPFTPSLEIDVTSVICFPVSSLLCVIDVL